MPVTISILSFNLGKSTVLGVCNSQSRAAPQNGVISDAEDIFIETVFADFYQRLVNMRPDIILREKRKTVDLALQLLALRHRGVHTSISEVSFVFVAKSHVSATKVWPLGKQPGAQKVVRQ
jgi:hypothetical protein